MTTRVWNGRLGDNFGTASAWTPNGIPASGDLAIINAAKVMTGGNSPANLTIQVNAGSSSLQAAELDYYLGTVTVGDRITLTATQYGSATFESEGLVYNNGLISFQQSAGATGVPTGVLNITSAYLQAGSLKNQSVIELAARDVILQGMSLVNNGSIILAHPALDTADAYSLGDFEVATSGQGTIHIGTGTEADFNVPIGAGQTIAFEPGSLAPPTAIVERPATFAATFANFTSGSKIVLSTPLYDATQVVSSGGVTVLSFTKAGAAVASLRFQGSYTPGQLVLTAVPNGTTLVKVTITTTQAVVTDAGSVANEFPATPVFRFFDTQLGTHFFTADINEVGQIQRTRPDLTSEGVGLRAVNPVANDANAAPVYRFFDSVAGTHFFTASETEKADIIATRPDLVFEPSSVFSEHLTAQAGDAPVYRFFDSVHGTHFYTADATERAGIVTTRPDLIAEGISFYAPAN